MSENDSARPAVKVFCVGFQKTGTTSMEAALQMLGYRVASVYGRDLSFEELRATYVARGLARAQEVDAVQDMPWPLLFRELDATFPDAKFVLTLRDEDAWWGSILGHFAWFPDVMQQLTYGEDAPYPFGHERRYREVYRAHNAAVAGHFADRPDKLLTLDFSAPVSWAPICAFLGAPTPDAPFPKANQPRQLPSLRRTLRRRLVRALNVVASR